MTEKSSYEDRQEHIPMLKTPVIENWKFVYPGSETNLRVETNEFTCVCPKTGLPDYATIIIEYRPNKHCLELKSFKEYLLFYRDIGVFHEHVTNKILKDCVDCVAPKFMKITGIFNSRGGIQTTVVATFNSES